MNIEGVSAAVTGGASGLGEATIRELARGGAKVAIFDRDAERGEKVAGEVGGIFVACDVADEDSMIAAFKTAADANGPVRILVNCAGIGPAARTVSKGVAHSLKNFRKIIDVNLIGSFNALRLAAEAMVAQDALDSGERGVIINTASIAAYEGQIGQAAYSASKGGVVGMTLPIARDLAQYGVRVVTIAPGLFETPLLATLPDAAKASLSAGVPFPSRLGIPAEYATMARFICENSMLNGETIRLDGALRMAPK